MIYIYTYIYMCGCVCSMAYTKVSQRLNGAGDSVLFFHHVSCLGQTPD